MKFIEITLVGLIVLGAIGYLCKALFLKKKRNRCGCSASGCKVLKPSIEKTTSK